MFFGKIYESIDRLWQWVSSTVFVRFEFELPVDELKKLSQNGRVMFALAHGGIVEWLILSSWSRKQGFPAILVANRKRILFFAKPLYFLQILFRHRSYSQLILEHDSGPRLLICPPRERKRLFEPTETEILISDLYLRASSQTPPTPIYFVPIFICWRKHSRGERRTLGEYLFGLSSDPNFIGKLWYLLRKRNDSIVRSLDVIPLFSTGPEASESPLEEAEATKVARVLRRKILVQINQEMRVVLGARYFSTHSVKETLMRDPEIQNVIAEIVSSTGADQKKVMAQAYQNLTEIAANYKYRFVEVMFVGLSWLFTKVFSGMVSRESDLQTVREVMKTKPVVFVSCHRSHLDYLVVPYLLFLEDMVTPYIVAGINLAFWPVGHFLRLGGAFFIRRSFRGDALYSVCLRRYIEFLIKNRHNIKFFIEGTRSRTGKMLPPAYGILKMVMEAGRGQTVEDIALVPVSICYDEVLEEGSYSKELSGGSKEKESAKGLLASRKMFKKNIGKVYVRFAPPLFTKEITQTAAAQELDPVLTLQKTAFQLCKNINDITPVTPKSIVSSILLCHERQQLTLEELLRNADILGSYVEWSKMDLSTGPGSAFRRNTEQTIRQLQQKGILLVSDGPPRSYQLDPKRRIPLNFYKNNGIHCLVLPGISLLGACDVLSGPPPADFFDAVVNRTLTLRNVLKFEFFFSPTQVFAAEVQQTLSFLAGKAEMTSLSTQAFKEGVRGRFPMMEDASVLIRLLGELLESYLSVGKGLKAIDAQTVDQKALVQRLMKMAQAEASVFPESISIQNFGHAVKFFENLGQVTLNKTSDKAQVTILPWKTESETALAELARWMKLTETPAKDLLR